MYSTSRCDRSKKLRRNILIYEEEDNRACISLYGILVSTVTGSLVEFNPKSYQRLANTASVCPRRQCLGVC